MPVWGGREAGQRRQPPAGPRPSLPGAPRRRRVEGAGRRQVHCGYASVQRPEARCLVGCCCGRRKIPAKGQRASY
eukprot:11193333-Lingulodinium_polyedra.AAC.1